MYDDLNFAEFRVRLKDFRRVSGERAGMDLFATLHCLGFISFEFIETFPDENAAAKAWIDQEQVSIKSVVDRRLAFIREKNWAEADKIRDALLAQGIQLKDGKDPVTGERVTTWEVKR